MLDELYQSMLKVLSASAGKSFSFSVSFILQENPQSWLDQLQSSAGHRLQEYHRIKLQEISFFLPLFIVQMYLGMKQLLNTNLTCPVVRIQCYVISCVE
jgi:hypothetical protein